MDIHGEKFFDLRFVHANKSPVLLWQKPLLSLLFHATCSYTAYWMSFTLRIHKFTHKASSQLQTTLCNRFSLPPLFPLYPLLGCEKQMEHHSITESLFCFVLFFIKMQRVVKPKFFYHLPLIFVGFLSCVRAWSTENHPTTVRTRQRGDTVCSYLYHVISSQDIFIPQSTFWSSHSKSCARKNQFSAASFLKAKTYSAVSSYIAFFLTVAQVRTA